MSRQQWKAYRQDAILLAIDYYQGIVPMLEAVAQQHGVDPNIVQRQLADPRIQKILQNYARRLVRLNRDSYEAVLDTLPSKVSEAMERLVVIRPADQFGTTENAAAPGANEPPADDCIDAAFVGGRPNRNKTEDADRSLVIFKDLNARHTRRPWVYVRHDEIRVNIDQLLIDRRWESLYPDLKLSQDQLDRLLAINLADVREYNALCQQLDDEIETLQGNGQITAEKFEEIMGALGVAADQAFETIDARAAEYRKVLSDAQWSVYRQEAITAAIRYFSGLRHFAAHVIRKQDIRPETLLWDTANRPTPYQRALLNHERQQMELNEQTFDALVKALSPELRAGLNQLIPIRPYDEMDDEESDSR